MDTRKRTLLIVGCGDIALRAAPLLQTHYRLVGLCRKPESRNKLRLSGIIPVHGDLDLPDSLGRISGLADAVLHLAPPPEHGHTDSRTSHLLSALAKRPKIKGAILPQRFVYISTTGVYGDCQGGVIDETRPVNPESRRAARRVDAERQIRAWGQRNGTNVSILRVPGIYALDRLPLARLRQKECLTLVSEEDGYTNHIHADDLARIVVAALRHAQPGRIYNVSDDSSLKMGDYFDLIADHFRLARPRRISRAQAEGGLISKNLFSFMRESRRLMNMRMKHELHISLRYPAVSSCLACSMPAQGS